MTRMKCGVRLVDRVLTNVLQDTVGVVVMIEDIHYYTRLTRHIN